MKYGHVKSHVNKPREISDLLQNRAILGKMTRLLLFYHKVISMWEGQRRTTTTTTIKLILLCFLLFASFSNLHDGIVNVEAFVAPKALLVLSPPTSSLLSSSSASSTASSDIFDTSNNNNNDGVDILQASTTFKHADVEWKIQPWFRPEPESSSSEKKEKKILDKLKRVWVSSKFLRKKLMLKAAANIIRLDCFLKKRTAPKVLCPKGGQAVLEAFVVNKDKNKRSGLGGEYPKHEYYRYIYCVFPFLRLLFFNT